jgi:hypothetical protein
MNIRSYLKPSTREYFGMKQVHTSKKNKSRVAVNSASPSLGQPREEEE